jgi:hypothetical protein
MSILTCTYFYSITLKQRGEGERERERGQIAERIEEIVIKK